MGSSGIDPVPTSLLVSVGAIKYENEIARTELDSRLCLVSIIFADLLPPLFYVHMYSVFCPSYSKANHMFLQQPICAHLHLSYYY